MAWADPRLNPNSATSSYTSTFITIAEHVVMITLALTILVLSIIFTTANALRVNELTKPQSAQDHELDSNSEHADMSYPGEDTSRHPAPQSERQQPFRRLPGTFPQDPSPPPVEHTTRNTQEQERPSGTSTSPPRSPPQPTSSHFSSSSSSSSSTPLLSEIPLASPIHHFAPPPLDLTEGPPVLDFAEPAPPLPLRVDISALPPHPSFLPPAPPPPAQPSPINDTPAFEIHDPLGENGGNGFDLGNGLIADEMYFDDDGLGTLEKIYLYARSRAIFHRVFIARSLPNFLPDVTAHEAVEYVLPLLNSLGTDPEDSVREAFVSELVPTMWWFYSNCQLVDDGYFALAPQSGGSSVHSAQGQRPRDQRALGSGVDDGISPSGEQEEQQRHDSLVRLEEERQSPDPGPLHQPSDPDVGAHVASPVESASSPLVDELGGGDVEEDMVEPQEPPLLPVQVFTPLLINLLLTANATIGEDTRTAIVEILRRIREGYGLEEGSQEFQFGQAERDMLAREMIYGIVIGLARMDSSDSSESGIGRLVGGRTDSDSTTASRQGRAAGRESDVAVASSIVPDFPTPADTPPTFPSTESNPSAPELTSIPVAVPETSEPVQIIVELPSPGLNAGAEYVASPSLESWPTSQSPAAVNKRSPPHPHPDENMSTASASASLKASTSMSGPPSPVPFPPATIQASSPILALPITPSDLSPSSLTPQPLHLSPLPPSTISPGTLMAQLAPSPGRSAPHTPPSPAMHPVRLPPAENTRYVNIPRTPFEGLPGDILGLNTTFASEAERLTLSRLPSLLGSENVSAPTSPPNRMTPLAQMPLPLEAASTASDETKMTSQMTVSVPPVEVFTATPPAPAGEVSSSSHLGVPLAEFTQHKTESWGETPAFGRRPSLSPVQPSSSGSSGNTSTPKRQESSRTESHSSERSGSTPTEGSSNETVTPSECPVASPGVEHVTAEHMIAVESVPPSMSFRSVPVPVPIQSVGHGSLSSSSSTTASTSTGGTGASRSSSTLDSAISWPSTSETPPSIADSDVIRTPENAEHDSVPSTKDLLPKKVADDINPYFLHTEGDEHSGELTSQSPEPLAEREEEQVTPPSRGGDRPPTRSASLPTPYSSFDHSTRSTTAAASSSVVDLRDMTYQPGMGNQSALSEEHPPQLQTVMLLDSESGLTQATSAQSTQPSRSPSHSVSPPLGRPRSRTASRPDNLPLPEPSLDSPYPSPPTDAPYPMQLGFDALLPDDLNSRLIPESGPGPEGRDPDVVERSSSPVVRLPTTSEIPDLDPVLGASIGIRSVSEASWAHHEGDVLTEGPGDSSEDAAIGRVASMSLIAAITAAGVLSEETMRMFVDEVMRVGKNPVYWVRREAAYALGALAKVAPIDILGSSLLPLYEAMTDDPEWHVRQSALFALPGILARLDECRKTSLALTQSRQLSRDRSREVRSALLEVMGEVIYCFRNQNGGPPTELVDLFVGRHEHYDDAYREHLPAEPQWGLIAPFHATRASAPSSSHSTEPASPPVRSRFEEYNDPSSSHFQGLWGSSDQPSGRRSQDASRDPERVLICAFNFPAVVAAMGQDRWPELRPFYRELGQDSQDKVRRTLGASIGEVARIIGHDHAHRDLMSLWWDLMHDDDQDTRAKVVGCVDTFVSALSPDDRQVAGLQLEGIWTSGLTGWRERETLAKQLGTLSGLVKPTVRGSSATILFSRAITDSVSAVREAAISCAAQYFEGLASDPVNLETAKQALQSLADADSYRKRVTYVAVVQSLLNARSFSADFSANTYRDAFIALSDDPIVDVRIGLSRLISSLVELYFTSSASREPWLRDTIRKLAHDSSPEVRSYVTILARRSSSAMSTPSPSNPSPFATFSRPPQAPTLITDSLDDLNDLDLDSDPNSAEAAEAARELFPSSSKSMAPSTDFDPFFS